MNMHDTTGKPKTGDWTFELMDSDKAMMCKGNLTDLRRKLRLSLAKGNPK
jgi:hypothetical protein